jgi:DNA mismatch repair ATPase MutS
MQLAMNGSYVFAKEARVSPIDDVFTCFDMGDSLGSGHFHTGAKKLINMRDNVTPYSLVLVDETGGGTEPEAESWIAAGVAKALSINNITALYVTHEKGIWKRYVGQDNVQFIRTSDLDDDERLFRIFPGIIESGYGKKIVRNLGLDPKTMNNIIKERFRKI